MADLGSMTLGEAEAYRAGFAAAVERAATLVHGVPAIYRVQPAIRALTPAPAAPPPYSTPGCKAGCEWGRDCVCFERNR